MPTAAEHHQEFISEKIQSGGPSNLEMLVNLKLFLQRRLLSTSMPHSLPEQLVRIIDIPRALKVADILPQSSGRPIFLLGAIRYH